MESSPNPFAGEPTPPEGKPDANIPPAKPYPSGQPPKPEPVDHFNTKIDPGDGKISYMRAWTFLTETNEWLKTWLLLSVVSLIPYIGQIVVQGYLFSSFEGVLRGYRNELPEFRFERFSEDLKRGIWPWLLLFVVSIVMQIIIQPLSHLLVLGVVAIGQNMDQETAILFLAVFIPLVILLSLGLSLLGSCLITPMYVRSGLSQSFKEGFNFSWCKQFFRLVWFELLLVKLFIMVSGIIAALVGIGFCFIGVFFTVTFFLIASMYLDFELYKLFLLRGGEPVPLKAPVPEIAETWRQP